MSEQNHVDLAVIHTQLKHITDILEKREQACQRQDARIGVLEDDAIRAQAERKTFATKEEVAQLKVQQNILTGVLTSVQTVLVALAAWLGIRF
jgi:hypothetical protein